METERQGEANGDDHRNCPRIRLVALELCTLPTALIPISTPRDVVDYLRQAIGRRDRETFVALHVNARLHITNFDFVSIGTLTESLVHPREVFKAAVLANAHGIICAQNHPSGDTTPSDVDHAVRERLERAGTILGIPLLDFIIVGSGPDYYAWSEPGTTSR